jgi:4-diphosphocytidyl-2-C-methyl-D-erythritol kinase
VSAVPAAVTVRVPAKVNLHLSVGPLRRDGFHELVTVYQALSLYDDVTVEPADALSVQVLGDDAGSVPTGEHNLALRAVKAVAALLGRSPDVSITIRKSIPVAGGMAGGSADAAAALIAADQLWSGGLDRVTLEGLAAGLGSDVPFLLYGGSALGTGRGERISPVLTKGDYAWVLAVAEGGLSTADVYSELDRLREAGPQPRAGEPDGVLSALRAGDVVALAHALRNDLQAPALRLRPQLQRVLDAGRELGAVGGIVSGSGPTVALLARSAEASIGLASSLAGLGVCRAVRRAQGPVLGARTVAGPDAR